MNRQAGGEARPGEAVRGVRDPTVTASSCLQLSYKSVME